MSRQPTLDKKQFKSTKAFGGTLLKKSTNRTARPLCTKRAIHVVLRSSQAKGDWSFHKPRNSQVIQSVLAQASAKFGVKIYRFANVGNHLHLVIKLSNRFTYASFIRSLTGTLALKITGANKFKALKEKFWDRRPFTRIVEWGRGFRLACDYVLLNELEGLGVFSYSKNRLRDVLLHPFASSA